MQLPLYASIGTVIGVGCEFVLKFKYYSLYSKYRKEYPLFLDDWEYELSLENRDIYIGGWDSQSYLKTSF